VKGAAVREADSVGLTRHIKAFLLGRRIAAVGVADLRGKERESPGLWELMPERFDRAVVLAVRLPDAVVDAIVDRPTPAYFHVYRQANYLLDRVAFELTSEIERVGYRAFPVAASQYVATDPFRGQISHRLLGFWAGLGWIGRSTLLVHPGFGARLRLASVLTDAPLAAATPLGGSCKDCRRCIDACPAQAIGETSREFDLEACYRKLCDFAKIPFVGQHVCGVCVKACPLIEREPSWAR